MLLSVRMSVLSAAALEVVYVTIGNLAFCLALYLTGIHFRGELQHVGDDVLEHRACWNTTRGLKEAVLKNFPKAFAARFQSVSDHRPAALLKKDPGTCVFL